MIQYRKRTLEVDMYQGQYLIGVDVGGTTAKIGLFNRNSLSEILVKTAVPTRTENDGVHILPDIAEAISVMVEEGELEMKDIAGIGIGVPGPVIRDQETGNYVVNRCVNLNWGVKDVTDELSALTGVDQIVMVNDANAAALGEVLCGNSLMMAKERGTYHDTVAVVVTIGTGIGGGVVKDGQVHQGAFGSAGEIGHIKTAPQHPLLSRIIKAYDEGKALTPEMRPDAFSDLEYYSSATGIARVACTALDALPDESSLRDLVKQTPEGAPDYSDIDAKAVFDAAKEGDDLSLEVVDLFADTLGIGLGAVAAVIDPDVFIIGGGVAAAGDFLLSKLIKAYRSHVFHASSETQIELAVLGNDAGMIGAACALLQ